jgi:hypothetical protein
MIDTRSARTLLRQSLVSLLSLMGGGDAETSSPTGEGCGGSSSSRCDVRQTMLLGTQSLIWCRNDSNDLLEWNAEKMVVRVDRLLRSAAIAPL